MCRCTAPFHVQLELEKVRNGEQVSGQKQFRGRVVRVFRTDSRLTIGDDIEFPLWVCQKGDEPTGPAYIYDDDLAGAAFMEAYLYGTPPSCELAAYEFGVISAPTDQPTMSPADLEKLLDQDREKVATPERVGTAKWWQFWRTPAARNSARDDRNREGRG
jgi:hypothetical protein